MVRIIIVAGGTGGHLFPGIALAQELRKRYKDIELFFVGTKRGVESRELSKLGFNLETISIVGLSRKNILRNISAPFYLFKGLAQSFMLLNRIKPGVVIGTGGYVSYPVLLLASLKKILTLIQEQNSFPGMTTRLLAPRVDKVCLTYPGSLKYFPSFTSKPKKFKILGNPIRKEVTQGNRDLGLKRFNLSPDKKTIFIFGGSQGSHKINLTVLEALDYFGDNLQLLWQTGEKDFDATKEKTREIKMNLSLHPFIDDMGSAYAVADLVISRAGALTLAEITACGKPAILIPYPSATADHQKLNAQELEKSGAAKLILENDLNGKKLANLSNRLFADKSVLEQMSQASRNMAKLDATSKITDEIEELLKR
ncbi:MAG TPA: undecaprenyldiphospho-muramoylpentapeptide beta-N-acetylglucosaminyltransferase [candidate division Zixibacteria bacterium]